jgi:Protein of unknown function (DUF3107)
LPPPGTQRPTNEDNSTATGKAVKAAPEKKSSTSKPRAKKTPAPRAEPVSTKELGVEVKIGVQYAPRELVLESTQSPAEVEKAVNDALSGVSPTLSLVDDKGRRVIVPVDKIAYVEIAESSTRTVGFTAG